MSYILEILDELTGKSSLRIIPKPFYRFSFMLLSSNVFQDHKKCNSTHDTFLGIYVSIVTSVLSMLCLVVKTGYKDQNCLCKEVFMAVGGFYIR